jgi:hypothetical protein
MMEGPDNGVRVEPTHVEKPVMETTNVEYPYKFMGGDGMQNRG